MYFGPFGGQYVPETLVPALDELEKAYLASLEDPSFSAEMAPPLRDYVGRPSPLYFAPRITESLGGAKVYLKREDLNHTGAHKINNALGQVLLARRIWARGASSPRRVRECTAWQLPPRRPSSASSAWSTWARRTCTARPPTWPGWTCSAQRSCPSCREPGPSRTR